MAVLAVVLFHAGLLPYGYLGVDLFFALSGFLITGILVDARGPGMLGPFYVRRALRILPLAVVVGLTTIVVTRAGWPGLWYLSYIQNWFSHPGAPRALAHYWSLAVEEQFYLVWPMAVLLVPPKHLWRIAVGWLAAGLMLRAWLMHSQPAWATAHILGDWTLVRADPMAAGALVALTYRSAWWDRGRGWVAPFAIASALAATVCLWWQAQGTHTSRGYTLAETVIAGAMAGLVWLTVASPIRPLTWRWFRGLGTISYGVYLIHAPLGAWFRTYTTQPIALGLLTLSTAVPLAFLSWRFLERPILAYKRYWPMPDRAESPPVLVAAD